MSVDEGKAQFSVAEMPGSRWSVMKIFVESLSGFVSQFDMDFPKAKIDERKSEIL